MISRGMRIYTSHADGIIRVRDSYSLQVIELFQGHNDVVFSLCFDESNILYSTGFDGTIKKWNMETRKVAFSFENRNASVTALAAENNLLFVGLKSGSIISYDVENAFLMKIFSYHDKTVTSLSAIDGTLYSSGLDGLVLQSSQADENESIDVYNSKSLPLKDLAINNFNFVIISDDDKVVLKDRKDSTKSSITIDFQTPLVCVAATDAMIYAGSRSGVIYSLRIETQEKISELKGHVGQVNDLLVNGGSLFSASDDKSIIEWSLEEMTPKFTYKRTSSSSPGHLGPVTSLAFCLDTLFSGGSEGAVRRWNTVTKKHDDVYFGFSKSVSAVLCHNSSVIAGSEDRSVLLFDPVLPLRHGSNFTTRVETKKARTRQKKAVRASLTDSWKFDGSIPLIIGVVAAIFAVAIIGAYISRIKKQQGKIIHSAVTENTVEKSDFTVTDLQTVINSVIGISKHAAYLIEHSAFARVKKVASGGGGEVYLAKVMDSALRKKVAEFVIQKVVTITNSAMEEAFYQEVGIMIMLSTFPHFCEIIGYTEKPLSIILKYYPDGSLYEWLRKKQYKDAVILRLIAELATALNIMHCHYLAHCDIKPQNILVQDNNGRPSCYLTDFGITQILSDRIIASKMFQFINLRGISAQYAAPEAYRSFRSKNYAGIDFKKFDIYSLSCVLYEMMTKTAPWS
jgi:WD40 repeat protein